jgi:hypothetical protein
MHAEKVIKDFFNQPFTNMNMEIKKMGRTWTWTRTLTNVDNNTDIDKYTDMETAGNSSNLKNKLICPDWSYGLF